ncbi:unnamed protein product, partial [marine sediment metagenome]
EHDDFKDISKIPHIKFFVDGDLKREIIGKDEEKLHRYVKRYSEIKLGEKKEIGIEGSERSVKTERNRSERSVKTERNRSDKYSSDSYSESSYSESDCDKHSK